MKKIKRPYSGMLGVSVSSLLPRIGIAALVCSSTAFLSAQDDDEEIFELSPFEVDTSEDTGWRSSNSTAGTTLNTAIKDIPMSIEVINSDFLDDIQADTFDEALEYSAGVNLDLFDISGNANTSPNAVQSAEKSASTQGGIGGRFTNGTNIRGFSVPFQNRLGFRYGGSIASFGVNMGGLIDNVNTGRLEVVRGPNSLLYGIGVLSGIVNVMPKRPLSEPAGSASIAVGSNDYYRRTFDWTAPLVKDLYGGDLSYRFAMAETRSGNETDVYEENKDYFVGQLEYRSDKLSVFLEVQHANIKQEGIGSADLRLNIGKDSDFRNEFYENHSAYEYYSKDGSHWDDKGYISGGEDYMASLRGSADLTAEEYKNVDFGFEDYVSRGGSAFTETEFRDVHYDGYVAGLQAEIDAIESDMAFLDLPSTSTAYAAAAADYETKKRHLREYNNNVELYGNVENYDPNFRLIDSDAYAKLDETDITFDLNYTPIENLTISVGAFLTDLEETTFSPSAGVGTNATSIVQAYNTYFKVSTGAYRDAQALKLKVRNGEELVIRDEGTDEEFDEALFLSQYENAEAIWNQYVTTTETPAYFANNRDYDFLDQRIVTYNWNINPKDTATEQYRGRVSYSFDTPDFIDGSNAKHVITGGFSYIHDVADFIAADPLGTGAVVDTSDALFYGTNGIFPSGDGITQLRNVTDFSPISYDEGTPTRLPGGRAWNVDVWYRSAYGLYTGNFFDDKLFFMAGYRYDEYFTRTQLYDRFDENAPFGGEDTYSEWLDANGYTDSRVSNGTTVFNPRPAFVSEQQLVWADPNKRFDYDYRIWADQEGESEYGPGDKPSSETSVTLAMNYDINDDLTFYAVSSGGVTPNIGYIDGNADPIPSEKTTNLEIGLKFELFDRKLSGSLSVYEITRENAIWTVSGAPRPASYYGAVANTDTNDSNTGFNPQAVIYALQGDPAYTPKYNMNYGVHQKVFKDATAWALESLYADPDSGFTNADFGDLADKYNPSLTSYDKDGTFGIKPLLEFVENPDTGRIERGEGKVGGIHATQGSSTVYIDYASVSDDIPVVVTDDYTSGGVTYQTQLHFTGEEYSYEQRVDFGRYVTDVYTLPYKLTTRDVLEQAFKDTERIANLGSSTVSQNINSYENYQPFLQAGGKQQGGWDENTSRVAGADATFTDIATGYDVQLQYSPTKSWQMNFTYAHTEREAQGAFQMVDPQYTAEDGETYYFGTEFDTFVRTFGRENYGLVEVPLTDENGVVLLDANGNERVAEVTLADGSPVGIGDVLASTATGGIEGLSLYYGFKDSASLYQKYTFREGFLKDLSIGLGVIYQGPANTSIAIGGSNLAENLYPTPDMPARVQSNMNINYNWQWGDFPIRAALRISNLGNDTHTESIVEYYNEILERVELRRSRRFIAPRSYRLSFSTTF